MFLDTKPYWWDIKGELHIVTGLAVNATKALSEGGTAWVNTKLNTGEDLVKEFTGGALTTVSIQLLVLR